MTINFMVYCCETHRASKYTGCHKRCIFDLINLQDQQFALQDSIICSLQSHEGNSRAEQKKMLLLMLVVIYSND